MPKFTLIIDQIRKEAPDAQVNPSVLWRRGKRNDDARAFAWVAQPEERRFRRTLKGRPMKSQFQVAAERSRKVARLRQRVNSRRYLGPMKVGIAVDRVLAAVAAPDPVQQTIDLQATHAIKEWDGE